MLASNSFRPRGVVVSALLVLFAKTSLAALREPLPLPKKGAIHAIRPALNPWKNWAIYSPYHSVGEWTAPPKTCAISQVNILQRHGAQAPHRHDARLIQATLKKIAGKKAYARPEMEFLKTYTYDLGTKASLIPVGAQQSREAATVTFHRYCADPHINARGPHTKTGKPCSSPFVRASDSSRVIDSAGNWSHAFTEVSHQSTATQVILAERKRAQNTLRGYCPRLNSSVPNAQKQWRAHWTTAVIKRLQSHEHYNLTGEDIANLAHLCAFESVQRKKVSPFCRLFLPAEFASIEYDGDLSAYYNDAYPGAPLARSQGVGYVHELLSRLTGDLSFVTQDRTQVDHALDAKGSSSFPLHKRIYADFTHHPLLLAVMTLIGLFQDCPLSTTSFDPHRSFIASEIVPFSGRLVVERLDCMGQKRGKFGFFAGIQQHVRIFVNDRALDLSKICRKANTHTQDTMCPLTVFVDAMKRITTTATKEFAKCGVIPTN